MTTRQVLAIAIKLFAIWFLSQLFIQVPVFVSYLQLTRSQSTGEVATWIYLLFMLSVISVGLISCKFIFSLSNSILNSSPNTGSLTVNSESQQYLLQLGGLYFFVTGLLKLIPSLIMFFPPIERIPMPDTKIANILQLTSLILNCGVGVWLIVHPSWWACLLKKLRGHA